MIGLDGVSASNVAERLLEATQRDRREHVFTLHAELEGGKLSPVFDRLCAGWKAQGYELVCLRALAEGLAGTSLPLHDVLDATVPGRSGTLACQGPVFLAEGRIP